MTLVEREERRLVRKALEMVDRYWDGDWDCDWDWTGLERQSDGKEGDICKVQ